MYMRLEEEKESGKDDEESDKKEENWEKVRKEKRTLMRSWVGDLLWDIHAMVSRGRDPELRALRMRKGLGMWKFVVESGVAGVEDEWMDVEDDEIGK